MKEMLRKMGKRGKCLLLAGVMTPALTACGHVVDPNMAQLPTYDMPAAVVVKTPPARLHGGAAAVAPGMPAPVAPPVMAGGVMGANLAQLGNGAVTAVRPDGATVIQQTPITVQHPSIALPQPPIWVGNPPMAIPSPPLIINQPAFSYNQAEILVHPPRVEFVETVVLPTQIIAAQPVIAAAPPPPPPPPPPAPIPEKPKVTPPPPIPKVAPVIPKEDVLPPK
ncbi:MAG: hypothetical protein HQL79_01960 [Magnetococcales bacterium]|nr:hypothetical protein [Magnetococcales bacterium]